MPPITRLCLLVVVGLATLVAPAPASAAFDYLANDGLSTAKYETEKTVVKLPAYDGRQLYIEVTKPKKAGRWPVVLESSPYHGTLADREGTRILPDPKDKDGKPLGLTGYFAPRGYAVVMMDLRGTGRSQGCLDHLGRKDARDLKQVVEWAASRAWSNGRVGMTGHSYVGSTPSVAAAQNPKGLKTIVPSAGLASMYDHQFQGGVPFFLQWAGPQWAYEYLTVARKLPPIGREPVQGSNTGDDFGNDMQETGCGAPKSALVAGEDQFSGRYSDWHLERDWREGATDANIPVFAVHGVNDNAARISALDWFLQRRDKRDKLWLGQWDHGSGVGPTRRGLQFTAALHAWFDRQLAGRKVETGPQIESFLADTPSFSEARSGARTEVLQQRRLPLNDTRMTLYPDADGDLRGTNAGEQVGSSFSGSPKGFSEFFGGDPTWQTGVSFRTPVQERDVLLNGVPELQLTASVSTPRTHLIANLLDEDPDGKRRRISQFAINPELRNGIAERQNVTPGEKYVMKPDGFVMAHHLRKGHRLVMQVTTSDPDKVPTFSNDPDVTVFTGGGDGTRVSLPIATKATLEADDVPFTAGEEIPPNPAQAPIEGSVTTKAPGLGVRVGGATSEYFAFDAIEDADNAKLEVVATPSQPADIDLYLQKQKADGSWTQVVAGDNGAELDTEKLKSGRLEPGRYRLDVHNWAGGPGNEVALKLTFFDSDGEPGA